MRQKIKVTTEKRYGKFFLLILGAMSFVLVAAHYSADDYFKDITTIIFIPTMAVLLNKTLTWWFRSEKCFVDVKIYDSPPIIEGQSTVVWHNPNDNKSDASKQYVEVLHVGETLIYAVDIAVRHENEKKASLYRIERPLRKGERLLCAIPNTALRDVSVRQLNEEGATVCMFEGKLIKDKDYFFFSTIKEGVFFNMFQGAAIHCDRKIL